MTTTETIEQRLGSMFDLPLTTEHSEQIDARVQTAIESNGSVERRRVPMSPNRPRLRLTRSMLLVAAMLIMTPLLFAAGAAIFSTEAPYGMGDADAYDAELGAAKAATPIPPGAIWPAYLDHAADRDATYGTGLGREMVEINAYCLWLGYWYEAQERRDLAAVGTAVAALNDARSWETFTDPLTSDEGFRNHTQETIDAAESGDARSVLGELELNCEGTWPAD